MARSVLPQRTCKIHALKRTSHWSFSEAEHNFHRNDRTGSHRTHLKWNSGNGTALKIFNVFIRPLIIQLKVLVQLAKPMNSSWVGNTHWWFKEATVTSVSHIESVDTLTRQVNERVVNSSEKSRLSRHAEFRLQLYQFKSNCHLVVIQFFKFTAVAGNKGCGRACWWNVYELPTQYFHWM